MAMGLAERVGLLFVSPFLGEQPRSRVQRAVDEWTRQHRRQRCEPDPPSLVELPPRPLSPWATPGARLSR